MRPGDEDRDDAVPDWRSAFRDAARPAADPHADFEFFDPFGGRPAPPGRMRARIRRLDGITGTIEAATALIADAVGLRGAEEVNVYYPGWFPDAGFGVIAIAGRSARPWGIIKFRRARRPAGDLPSIPRGTAIRVRAGMGRAETPDAIPGRTTDQPRP